MAKRNNGNLKQQVRILTRELKDARLEHSVETERMQKDYQSCQDSRVQLAKNCRHYRGRLQDALTTLGEQGNELAEAATKQRLLEYEAESYREEISTLRQELTELDRQRFRAIQAQRKLQRQRNTANSYFVAIVALVTLAESLRFFGVV